MLLFFLSQNLITYFYWFLFQNEQRVHTKTQFFNDKATYYSRHMCYYHTYFHVLCFSWVSNWKILIKLCRILFQQWLAPTMVLQLNWILTTNKASDKKGDTLFALMFIYIFDYKILLYVHPQTKRKYVLLITYRDRLCLLENFFRYVSFFFNTNILNNFHIMNQSQTNCHQISSHIIRKAQSNSIHLKKKQQHYVMYILIVTANIKQICLLKLSCFNINQN